MLFVSLFLAGVAVFLSAAALAIAVYRDLQHRDLRLRAQQRTPVVTDYAPRPLLRLWAPPKERPFPKHESMRRRMFLFQDGMVAIGPSEMAPRESATSKSERPDPGHFSTTPNSSRGPDIVIVPQPIADVPAKVDAPSRKAA